MKTFGKMQAESNKENADEYQLPIAEMYPELSPEQQAEAEYYLTEYFETIYSIFEEKYNLTSSNLNATFKREK